MKDAIYLTVVFTAFLVPLYYVWREYFTYMSDGMVTFSVSPDTFEFDRQMDELNAECDRIRSKHFWEMYEK
jgi:hypothetical protein